MAVVQKLVSSGILLLIVLVINCNSAPSNHTRTGTTSSTQTTVKGSPTLPPSVRVNSTSIHRTGRSTTNNNRTISTHSSELENDDDDTSSNGFVKNQHFQVFQRRPQSIPASSSSQDSSEILRTNPTQSRNATHGHPTHTQHILLGSGAVLN